MSYFDSEPSATAVVVANVLSVVSLLLGIVAESFRKKRTTLIVSAIVKIPSIVTAILLRAINSLQSAVVGPIRNLICLYVDNKSNRAKIAVSIIMSTGYVILYLSGYQGIRTIFGLLGVIGVVISNVWFQNRGRWKMLIFLTCPCYIVYNLMTLNYSGAIIITCELIHHIIMLRVYKEKEVKSE